MTVSCVACGEDVELKIDTINEKARGFVAEMVLACGCETATPAANMPVSAHGITVRGKKPTTWS